MSIFPMHLKTPTRDVAKVQTDFMKTLYPSALFRGVTYKYPPNFRFFHSKSDAPCTLSMSGWTSTCRRISKSLCKVKRERETNLDFLSLSIASAAKEPTSDRQTDMSASLYNSLLSLCVTFSPEADPKSLTELEREEKRQNKNREREREEGPKMGYEIQ